MSSPIRHYSKLKSKYIDTQKPTEQAADSKIDNQTGRPLK